MTDPRTMQDTTITIKTVEILPPKINFSTVNIASNHWKAAKSPKYSLPYSVLLPSVLDMSRYQNDIEGGERWGRRDWASEAKFCNFVQQSQVFLQVIVAPDSCQGGLDEGHDIQ